MQSQQQHNFTLTDRWGNSHEYVCILHPGSKGVPIAFEIAGLVGPTVARVLLNAVSNIDGLAELFAPTEGAEPGAAVLPTADDMRDRIGKAVDLVLGGADIDSLTRQLGDALLRESTPELIAKILGATWRDQQRLSDPMVFDAAIQGNYGELLKALQEVITFNGFFPWEAIFSNATPAPARPGTPPAPQPQPQPQPPVPQPTPSPGPPQPSPTSAPLPPPVTLPPSAQLGVRPTPPAPPPMVPRPPHSDGH